MSVDVAAIRAAFAACNLDLEDDAVTKCVSICKEFGLSSDDMAAQWDAYSMNQQLSGAANTDSLVAFRSHLTEQRRKNKEMESNATLQKRRQPRTPVIKRKIDTQDNIESLYKLKSPEGKNLPSFSSPAGSNKVQRANGMFSPSLPSPPGHTYDKRTDVGKIVLEFNSHLKKQLEGLEANTGRPVKIAIPFPSRNQTSDALYMYTPLFERAIALDKQLVEYEELVKDTFNLEELQAIGDHSPAQVTVVGRIVCEAAEGKLNPSVVEIEGSRKTCGGQRVLLDLSEVPNFQIFQGKIVALEGVFSDTRSPMTVKRFLEPIPAPPSTTPSSRIKDFQSEHGNPLRVLTACGPFTITSNVDYLPLNDLLQIAIDQKPDVLILLVAMGFELTYLPMLQIGPFIDSIHSMFQDGLVKYNGMMISFDEIFIFKVMTLLNNLLKENDRTQVVIVPSLRDANHQYVYPQPPLNKTKACEAFEVPEFAKRVHFMSNPSTFSINGIVFGVSTLDVVMHLSSNELYRSQVRDPNRLLRLSEQVCDGSSNQCLCIDLDLTLSAFRSYYPIFPPPPSSEAPIDLKYMKQFQFERTPDILLLSSILNRFCGRAKDSICINPGQLCKGESGGTFAQITIFPLPYENIESASDDMCAHFIPDRSIVEIKRI
ncbi:hypothetical protein PsorP6_002114 [Peronosclerospora sorghi]|uniref:Uncharacterized protein n=1 Tax=Peronosclerospora sorghi TaxID=230839 RepID=A0ACC0WVB6_9STRA|nr:hypothetical protein PsorP6_002114 [Peronosclerospora sorghi]